MIQTGREIDGDTETRRDQLQKNPGYQQGPRHRTREARRGERTQDMAAEAGMRHGVQRQAAEAGRWRVGKIPGGR